MRYVVEGFNEEANTFRASRPGHVVRGSLDCSIFFRTVEEAAKEEHDTYKQGVHDARREVQDAIAAYRTINKIANMTAEQFLAILPIV